MFVAERCGAATEEVKTAEKLQHSSREVQSISQEMDLGSGNPREQLHQGLGARAEGAWVGVPVRLVGVTKPCWCPQDKGNEDNLREGSRYAP